LKEVKQVQLQVLELQALLRKDARNNLSHWILAHWLS